MREVVTYTDKFQFFLITFRNTNNHVVNQRTIQAVKSMSLFYVIQHLVFVFCQHHMSIFNCNIDRRINKLAKFAFRTFYSNYIILQSNCYSSGNTNG